MLREGKGGQFEIGLLTFFVCAFVFVFREKKKKKKKRKTKDLGLMIG